MQYANINNVYKRVRDILNKASLGQVSVSQFNNFAGQAQQELMEESLEALFAPYIKHRLQNLETVNLSEKKKFTDDISTLLIYNESQAASTGTNVFDYPSGYAYVVGITYRGNVVDIIAPEDATYYVNNYYSSPNDDFAVAVMGSHQIEVTPTTLAEGIKITYYRIPMGSRSGVRANFPPSWAYQTSGEDLIYDAANSYDFELPKSVEEKLVYKVLSLAGFSIREPEAIQYANMQEQKDDMTEGSMTTRGLR